MKNFENDSKYEGVRKVLQNLNKIEAPPDFEQKLFERISQDVSEKEELSFIDKLFLPSRLLPSVGLALTIVLIFFLTNIFIPSNDENPLLTNPRVRVDVISANNLSVKHKRVDNKTKSDKKNEVFDLTEIDKLKRNLNNNNSTNDPNLGIRITGKPNTSNYYNGSTLTSVSPNGFINKRGLDYKLIYLQRLQRAQIEQMRKRVEEMMRNSQR